MAVDHFKGSGIGAGEGVSVTVPGINVGSSQGANCRASCIFIKGTGREGDGGWSIIGIGHLQGVGEGSLMVGIVSGRDCD